jgi:hypothetical protein
MGNLRRLTEAEIEAELNAEQTEEDMSTTVKFLMNGISEDEPSDPNQQSITQTPALKPKGVVDVHKNTRTTKLQTQKTDVQQKCQRQQTGAAITLHQRSVSVTSRMVMHVEK